MSNEIVIEVRTVKNGYMAFLGERMDPGRSPYVFETFQGLVEWLDCEVNKNKNRDDREANEDN